METPATKTPRSRHQRPRRREGDRSEKSSNKGGSNKGGSNKTKSNQSSSQHIRECACLRGLSCIGMTQAFRLLGDPRCYYVELPRYRKDPPTYKYVFRNNLRAAYIRHLALQNPSTPDLVQTLAKTYDRRYVALHHFHPRIVQAFYANPLTKGAAQKHKVPISITEHELIELGLEVYQEDRILSLTGQPTGGYYFCPGYSQGKAHEDLKALIKKERGLREATEKDRDKVAPVPIDIQIRAKALQVAEDAVETSITRNGANSKLGRAPVPVDKKSETSSPPFQVTTVSPIFQEAPIDDDKNNVVDNGLILVKESTTEADFIHAISGAQEGSEFDSLWNEDGVDGKRYASSSRGLPSIVFEESAYELAILEAEDNTHQSLEEIPTIPSITKTSNRDADHPWHIPKYRRSKDGPETSVKKVGASPAQFIDPTIYTPNKPRPSETDFDSVRQAFRTEEGDSSHSREQASAMDRIIAAQKSAASISAAALKAIDSIEAMDTPPRESAPEETTTGTDPPGWSGTMFGMTDSTANAQKTPPRIFQSRSYDSTDSASPGGISLNHKMPGFDPTMRIQVHNDLIAGESKRRSNISAKLERYDNWWQELKDLVEHGMEEVEFTERFVSGFSLAGILFADTTEAVCDDTFLDDEGSTVNNAFIQNRLTVNKKRTTQESFVENQDRTTEFGQSTLLTSILSTQLDFAKSFRDSSAHINEEIMPELEDLKRIISTHFKDYERLGTGIIAELKRSEIELKNIWDVFDAMVTGDLMEYTAHGSLHGSQHGSQHGGTLHSYGSPGRGNGSLHGIGEGPVISSMQSPAIKSTFRQLGAVEDGWLVEMYYRAAVSYQRAVFSSAEGELMNMTKRIADLEEERFGKLHQVLLSFVPRQRRLFNALPEQFKGVLDNLVGLRIDEDTLQALIDEMIKERSYDHLKRGASHRSSIMNRSRLNTDNEETEVENIESRFGNPFNSPKVLLSKVVGLQFRGLVNATWKEALVVVSLDGNLVVLTLPDGLRIGLSPMEAFRSLCPEQRFDSLENWKRTTDIGKTLTPTLVISLSHASFSVPNKNHPCQMQIVEDIPGSRDGTGTVRFMRAMRAAADSQFSKKCIFRLSSASEVTEWMQLLERTKTVMMAKEGNNSNDNNKKSGSSPKKRFPF